MDIIEFMLGILVATPLMIIGVGIFGAVWFYCFKWALVWLVSIGEKLVINCLTKRGDSVIDS